MSSIHVSYDLRVPATLESQLLDFRRRVWTIKLAEALGVAAFSIGLAYLCTFAIDRLWDTPAWVRATVLAAALAACLIAPYYVHRWIWSQRRLEQLAACSAASYHASAINFWALIELAHSQSEQARSPTLCKAAIEQVAHDAAKRDFRMATPNSYHRLWSVLSAAVFVAALALFGMFPSAAGNAWGALPPAVPCHAALHLHRNRAAAPFHHCPARRTLYGRRQTERRYPLASCARPRTIGRATRRRRRPRYQSIHFPTTPANRNRSPATLDRRLDTNCPHRSPVASGTHVGRRPNQTARLFGSPRTA